MSSCHGGYLAIGTTALDPRVTACLASYPSFCDVTGYLHGRAGGAPMLFADHLTNPACPRQVATTAYYDTVNFAKRIKAPGHYGWGYNDMFCPPTSIFSAYNMIRASKTLFLVKEMMHLKSPRLMLAETIWLHRQVGRG
jgi:cephalosporin-C deacetylase-like acetyl esterase